jgi:hypothetical protein
MGERRALCSLRWIELFWEIKCKYLSTNLICCNDGCGGQADVLQDRIIIDSFDNRAREERWYGRGNTVLAH